MATYLHPGVYVNEVKMGAQTLEGGSPSVAGFMGFIPRGKRNTPIEVTSWTDFKNKVAYGLDSPFMANSYLTYSVFGFFQNGGQRAYIMGITDGTEAASTVSIDSSSATAMMNISAIDPGTWGDKLAVKFESDSETELYNFVVKYDEEVVETYTDIDFDSASANFIENRVNDVSKYVTVEYLLESADTPDSIDVDNALTSGADGLSDVAKTDFTSALTNWNEVVDEISMLIAPDMQDATFIGDAIAYCKNMQKGKGELVFLADAPEETDYSAIQTFAEGFNDTYGALYYPWIEISDPISNKSGKKTKFVPLAGHMAGVIARIDGERSVYKAPAGLEAQIVGAISLKYKITDVQQDALNPLGINVARVFKNTGIIMWGARTLDKTGDPAKYLNIRRGLNYIKRTARLGTKWAVFEPNNNVLWRRLSVTLRSFLLLEYSKGGFKGSTPEQSFFVKCDGELNTTEVVKAGQVRAEIGVAIAEPGEFVIINIGQWDGGSAAVEG